MPIIYASSGEGGPTIKDLGWDFSTYVTLDFLELGKWDSQVMTALLFDMYINYLQFLLLQCCYESWGYTLSWSYRAKL